MRRRLVRVRLPEPHRDAIAPRCRRPHRPSHCQRDHGPARAVRWSRFAPLRRRNRPIPGALPQGRRRRARRQPAAHARRKPRHLRELEAQRLAIPGSIHDQGKLTPELECDFPGGTTTCRLAGILPRARSGSRRQPPGGHASRSSAPPDQEPAVRSTGAGIHELPATVF
jgi:hypothetical protein